MVSRHFVGELAKRADERAFHITVLGEEPRPAYDRVHLTDYFRDRDPAALSLGDSSWYTERRATLITGRTVVSIDRADRSVVDDSGHRHPYDLLVLACGSIPFVPPIEGSNSPGVFVYRTIEDAQAIIKFAAGKRAATVLGGGLLGLEAANAVKGLGLDATIIEYANGLMPRQLNQNGSRILENEVRRLGVSLLLGKGVQRIDPKDGYLELSLNDGSSQRADLVIVAAGVRPRDELAKSADVATGARGGIIVDDSLRASDPNVFAIGECALHRGQVYGFVSPGYQMAETLADQLCGGSRVFEGADTSCRLKLMGVEVSVFGNYLGEGKTLAFQSPSEYRMLVLKQDKLIGGTVVGKWSQAHQLQLAIREQRFLSPSQQSHFELKGEIDADEGLDRWPSTAIVCNCAQVTKGALSLCIERGCRSVEALGKETRAGTICGSCRPLLAELAGVSGGEPVVPARGRALLLAAALVASLVLAALAAFSPLPPPDSVQNIYFDLAKAWSDPLAKQISGYTIAGLSLLALGLSARRRIPRLRWGNYGWWRAVHSSLGSACLLAMLAHTGLNFGENLNLWLMATFVGLNLAGAFVALSVAMEHRYSGSGARRIRSFATKLHFLFFWPYPVLLGLHIYAVYRY